MNSISINDSKALKGVFPALFTPLCPHKQTLHNSIDYDKAKMIIDDLIHQGIHGLVPMGTTGQSATVTHEQHLDFVQFVVEYVDRRVPIIAGAGSNSTRESIEMINLLQKKVGSLSFLCVTGYYNTPPMEGIILHFNTLTQETGAKLVVYNVPGRTQSYLTPETVIELAKNPSLIGLKQAVNFSRNDQYKQDTQKIMSHTHNFSLLSGEDDGFYSMLKLGGQGIITATGNIPEASKIFVQIFEQFNQGNESQSQELQNQLNEFAKMCFIAKNPIPLATFFNSPVYLPLISLKDVKNGESLESQFLDFMHKNAPSLKKYHP